MAHKGHRYPLAFRRDMCGGSRNHNVSWPLTGFCRWFVIHRPPTNVGYDSGSLVMHMTSEREDELITYESGLKTIHQRSFKTIITRLPFNHLTQVNQISLQIFEGTDFSFGWIIDSNVLGECQNFGKTGGNTPPPTWNPDLWPNGLGAFENTFVPRTWSQL